MINVLHGDCCEIMPTLEAESFDAIVTDPPGGISFMGKTWDGDRGGRDHWIAWMQGVASECLRLAKPGAHALVWALPRTSHWTATAWENAGWEVRDRIAHLFGTGFPKSLNVSCAIDDHFFHEWLRAHPEHAVRLNGLKGNARKEVETGLRRLAGLERKIVAPPPYSRGKTAQSYSETRKVSYDCDVQPITAPATPEAAQWIGHGTGLKPACEDWWLLRKPLSERTVAANVLAHGTGSLNVDACRVQSVDQAMRWETPRGGIWSTDSDAKAMLVPNDSGRWPANLCHDGSPEVLEAFVAFGERKSGELHPWHDAKESDDGSMSGKNYAGRVKNSFGGDSGSPARFFFSAKANADDRMGTAHPTTKPTALIAWLLKLVTPPGGHVLDPFAGSGTLGVAAKRLGFSATLIESDEEYVGFIKKRMAAVTEEAPLLELLETPKDGSLSDSELPLLDFPKSA